jgi:hypothetical protein
MHLASTDTTGFQPLCSKPSFQTSQIQNWTSFVDNDTASHLLSLYFAWENPVWHLVDQDMFLHDLETGGRRFCSPLLVHVLLFFGVVPPHYPQQGAGLTHLEHIVRPWPDHQPAGGKGAWETVI